MYKALFLTTSIEAQPIVGKKIEIQILDKVTAKVKSFNLDVNQIFIYETLIIEVFACYKNPPQQIPENYVLLRVYDKFKNENKKIIYQGWMISSSPSTTPLTHPIYDLWLKDCKI